MRGCKWVARYLRTKEAQEMEGVIVGEDGSRRFYNVSFSVYEIERILFIARVILFIIVNLKVASAVHVCDVVFTVF
jgi:hypothetical protein